MILIAIDMVQSSVRIFNLGTCLSSPRYFYESSILCGVFASVTRGRLEAHDRKENGDKGI